MIKINHFQMKIRSGFRKTFFTESFFSYLNNKIATGYESGLYTDMILIHLHKAFDKINHEILINKIENLGFSKNFILWSKKYLSNTKFKVILSKNFLESGNVYVDFLKDVS